MAFDVEAAKAEGYTDEEIQAYLRGLKGEPVATQEQPSRGAEMAGTAIPVAASAIPAVGAAAAAGYGLAKYGPDIVRSAGSIASKMMGGGQAPTVGTPRNPIGAPTNVPVSGPVNPAQSIAVNRAPTAPSNVIRFPGATAAPQAVAEAPQTMLDKTTSLMRQLAANKVVQGVAKGGAAVTAALTPGNIGQDYQVPQTGRMRGMEINPMTGRPWTKEQLSAYESNPNAFDQMLGAPQMPR
jgi:hypothetical protein